MKLLTRRWLRESGTGDILAMCGGACSCATCHIYVEPGFEAALAPIGIDEDHLLDSSSHRRPTSLPPC